MNIKFTLLFLFYSAVLFAQGNNDEVYHELVDPKPVQQAEWNELKGGVNVSFASVDTRYEKSNVPSISPLQHYWQAKAWKGEKVHAQILVWANRDVEDLRFSYSNLTDGKGNIIAAKNVSANFIRYVMADGLNDSGGGCGIQPGHDSSLVADVIDNVKSLPLSKNSTRPVWLSIKVPQNTTEGIYNGTVTVWEGKGKELLTLYYTIQVLNHTLPAPEKWRFHLDLWQNPYSVARINHVKPWSKQHFDAMRPYMSMLANAGQKAITATLIYDPWNSQTYDVYDSMIKWTKRKNGTWAYDYTVFDKWVSFMMSAGVNKLINCYSMIPWNSRFYYYDEASGKDTSIVAKSGSLAYEAHWRPMLIDFARHLKKKGWFNITTIAMDERPLEDMQKAIAVTKNADEDFKVSLAGNFHHEIEKNIFDYSVASNQVIDQATLTARKNSGLNTTYYTCCTEGYPNTFSFSKPAEAVWLGWHAAYKGYNGYLRWAYNNWAKSSLHDTRFGQWSSGDAFVVYPGVRSSVRFERLIEGIQDFEKIRILKETFLSTNQQDKLRRLENMLNSFDIKKLTVANAAEIVGLSQSQLNSF